METKHEVRVMTFQNSSNHQGEPIADNLVNQTPAQLLVIDPQVEDYQHLAAGIHPGVELLILDPDRDGIEQITEYLTGESVVRVRSVGSVGSNLPHPPSLPISESPRLLCSPSPLLPVSSAPHLPVSPSPCPPVPPSLHIISHGSPATIHLGHSTLELSNIEQYRHQLEKWQVNHILLYGCQVAAGDAGAEFLTKLHQITQAQIYANPHPTGNAAKGGTWELTQILPCPPAPLHPCPPAPLPLSPTTQQTYQGILSGDLLWAEGLGTSGDDQGRSIAVDSSGNSYITGHFSGNLAVGTDSLVGAGAEDIIITKLDPDGNYLWAKSLGTSGTDQGRSIAADNSGNTYITGHFSGNLAAGSDSLVGAGGEDIIITKLDPNGDYLWAESLGDTGNDRGWGINLDNSGNTYITGSFNGTVDFDPGAGTVPLTSAGLEDIFILKLDTNGNYVWATSFGGTADDYGYKIAVDGSGNIYTTGHFYGTVDFDPGPGTAPLTPIGTLNDIFITKFDASGNYVWAKNFGSGGYDSGLDITVDSSGNTYTTGYFSATVDFDPGTGVASFTSSGGSWDIFITKFDTNGNYVWAKSLGSTGNDFGQSIVLDNNGNTYITGSFTGTMDFDPGAGTANLTAAGGDDIFVVKLDANGNYVWAKNLGGGSSESGYGINVDDSGSIYTTGYFSGTGDFDPNTGVTTLTPVGSNDIFIAKLSGSPVITSVTSTQADGTYGIGTVIPITVTFSEAVNVTGTPTLTLNTGANISYASGSGTDTLTFNYTVAAGESTADLDHSATTALSLAGGTIKNLANTDDAILTLPTPGAVSSLGANKNLVIDGIAPTVTINQATGQTDPAPTSPINFTVTFSETVTGFDATDISFTGSTAGGTLTPTVTGSGTTYNVAVSGMTTSGTVIPTVIAGAVTDAAGNDNTASTSTDNSVTYNTIPTVSNISKTGNEDSNITFAAADFTAGFTDADGNSLNKIQITSLPANGTLQLSGGNVTLNQEILLANIPNLIFAPTANFNSSTSFTWNGSDGSNYAATAATANLTVAAINDTPSFSNSGNQTLTTWTNTAQTVSGWANTFVFGPTNENTQTVADFLVTVTSGNTLFTTLPDIANDGTLTYTPSGTPGTATIQVQLQDNGGVANSGVDTSAAATFTITVPPPTVNLSVNTTTGTEAGTTAITLTATAQGAVSGNQTLNLALTGTASNADFTSNITAQITIPDGSSSGQIILNIANDLLTEGDETATFTISNPSTGILLGTTTAQTITITDDDSASSSALDIITPLTPSVPPSTIPDNTPRVGVLQPVERLDVMEGGGEDIYELVLATQPTANVDIAIITDGQTTANVESVTFTPDNWNLPQVVVLSAVDDNVVEGFHTSNVRLVATSLDGDYNNLPISGLTVSIADNENVGLVQSFPNPTSLMATAGDDNLVGSAGGDIINARGGNNAVDGGAGNDVLLGGNDADYLLGGAGLDQILSGPGEDYVDGGDDDDVMLAGTGSDRLYGGAGNDKLFGEQGDDYLVGGVGVDTLTGGPGRDALAIGNGSGGMTVEMADVITDFVPGEDVIDLIAPLGYDGVAINDGTGLYAGDTLVQNRVTGEFLARLQGVDALSLSQVNFV